MTMHGMIRRGIPRSPLLAGIALIASGAITAQVLIRVVRPEPILKTPAERDMRRHVRILPRGVSAPAAALAAIENDPFHPERRRPAMAFRFPGEASAATIAAARPAESGVAPRLIGTVVQPSGQGFAMCQSGNEPPRIVRVGEHIGDFTLKHVEQGRAVFLASDGARVEVQAPKAGS